MIPVQTVSLPAFVSGPLTVLSLVLLTYGFMREARHRPAAQGMRSPRPPVIVGQVLLAVLLALILSGVVRAEDFFYQDPCVVGPTLYPDSWYWMKYLYGCW